MGRIPIAGRLAQTIPMTELRPAKAGITRADIENVVTAFYTKVRAHPRLGPIFARQIGTEDAQWVPHLAKIRSFWANVMLHERAYNGNPMQVHMGIPDIKPDDFAIWLYLFQNTASANLPTEKAETFDFMARRIGRSLKMGLERSRGDGPPILSG